MHSRYSSGSSRIFCSVCYVCAPWIKQKAWVYPLSSISNLDWGTNSLFPYSPAASIACLFEGEIGSRQCVSGCRFFVGLWLCPCNLSGCLTFQWSLEVIVAESIDQTRLGQHLFPGGLALHLQTHTNCTNHSVTSTFSACLTFLSKSWTLMWKELQVSSAD